MGYFWATPVQQKDEPVQVTPPKTWINEWLKNILWAPTKDIYARGVRASGGDGDITKCPVNHKETSKKIMDAASSGCPVNHLNNMPTLHSQKLPNQKMELPTSRTTSSIPRGDNGFWEYPSPQQMLNAMVRKSGYDGIEEEAVESMVDVHNFLNEGVWEEVLKWESPYTNESKQIPKLQKFQGRPGEISPKARILQLMGKIYPSKFGFPPPFDRHDWTVLRAVPNSDERKPVRYVIDFYEIEDVNGPEFTVDVRPAADSLENIVDRCKVNVLPTIRQALGWE